MMQPFNKVYKQYLSVNYTFFFSLLKKRTVDEYQKYTTLYFDAVIGATQRSRYFLLSC